MRVCLRSVTQHAGRKREQSLEVRYNRERMTEERMRPIEFRPYDLRIWDTFKNDMDIIRPWVCQKLESFILGIGNMPRLLEMGRLDEQVFARISELKEL